MAKLGFKDGYLKGYEDGLNEALDEFIKLTTKGYTPREMQIMLKSQKATLHHKIEKKRTEIERELEKYIPLIEDASEKPEPVKPEPAGERKDEVDLRPGQSYLIKEGKPITGFLLFSELLNQDIRGLCIARTPPMEIRRQYYIAGVEMVWLTTSEKHDGVSLGPGALGLAPSSQEKRTEDDKVEYVSPTNLASLFSKIQNFWKRNQKSVVILEGIEYLITQNGFNSVLKFIQRVRDENTMYGSYFILPGDPQAMESKNFKLLEREMTQVLERK